MQVTIHRILTGTAAQAGGVRFDIADTAMILLAVDQTVEEQAAVLGELLHPDDIIAYAITVPNPRPEAQELAAG